MNRKLLRKQLQRSNVDSIKYMITTFGATEKQILGNKNYSKKEYNTALKELAGRRQDLVSCGDLFTDKLI